MPTITTVDAAWTPSPTTFTDAEARRFDTAMFLGDGSNNGVRGGVVRHGDSSLAVTVNGSDQITVQAGAFVIPAATGLGVYRGALSAATAATGIAARNGTNPRIDLVVIEATASGAVVKTIEGTPSASPSAPALPAQHIELARLTVPALGGGAVTVSNDFRTYATGVGGTLYVATSSRLPVSGNQPRQRAVVLASNIEYVWDGTDWRIQRTDDAAVTAGVAYVTSTNTKAFIRGGLAFVNVDITTTAIVSIGDTLFNLGSGYRPANSVYGALVSSSQEAVGVVIGASGVVNTQYLIPSGRILRGQLVIPLP